METQTPQPHREKPAVGSPQPICDPMNPILGDEALALAEAEWAGVHSLTEAEQSCVRLLEVVRDYDWRTNVQPESSTQTPSVSTQYSALILHRRGEVATAPCTSCHDGKTGAFQSCVICPSFGNRSLWRGACTNCIYSGESATCSLRTSLDWDPAFNECLFAQYSGLRQAITDPDNTTLALLIGTAYGSCAEWARDSFADPGGGLGGPRSPPASGRRPGVLREHRSRASPSKWHTYRERP